jgi:hypothetical protein
MVSPGVADTITSLQKGRAMVEVAEIRPENNIRVEVGGSNAQLLKAGLYDFDADRGHLRVFDGMAVVQTGGQRIEVKSGHQLNLNAAGKLKPQKFDKKAYVDDFYRWASLRSSYLAEANVDAARRYAGAGGWSPSLWYGDGWYWDPWYGAYTFIPDDGIFFDPFGWGFYSPWSAFGAPYFGYGYGYGGYGGRGYYHQFGPGYHPSNTAGGRSSGFVGRAHSVGRGVASANRGSSFGGGGSRGGSASGFHGGGGGGHR